jgi:hypothetical protein
MVADQCALEEIGSVEEMGSAPQALLFFPKPGACLFVCYG